jgi:RNA polymerase sigma-70 factor (ECF subfamily)
MSDDETFAAMFSRVQAGDERAASELIHRYERHIRRVVRVRLTDPRMRRQLDSIDICQSVFADFFAHSALGDFELQNPEELIALLATMARNKLIQHVRKQHAARRDVRRIQAAEAAGDIAGREATPSAIVSGQELLDRLRASLTNEERLLADRRAEGRSWAEIAAETGGNADMLRMRLSRAVERVKQQLGMEGDGIHHGH